jgi:glycosyltransferase involved in cell wall biosynthesis
MRILMCSLDGPDPPTNGIRLAVGALLTELRRDNDVRFIGYRMEDQRDLTLESGMRLAGLPTPPRRGATLLRSTLRRRPWETDRLAKGLQRMLVEELEQFDPDVVHVTRWALAGLGACLSEVPSVLTAFDAWHLNIEASLALAPALRRPLIRAEARRVRRFEAQEFTRFSRVVVVSEQDRDALRQLNADLPISVIPNGVDADFYGAGSRTPRRGRLVFTGNMSYAPNVVAAEFLVREVLPRVRELDNDAHVVVVGRDPDPSVEALAAVQGATVTGEVDDIRPWLQGAQVFVCPMLSGTGIKNKLLEAMAAALPCVVTPLALQGLDVIPGEHLLVGDTADELARSVGRLLTDVDLAERIGGAARSYVRARHTWAAAAEAYEAIYKAVSSDDRTPR